MRALYVVSFIFSQPVQDDSANLMPSLKLLVTLSPSILVSTLKRETISPALRSANSGSCLRVAR